MTVVGYILLAVGVIGVLFAYVPALAALAPQAAALPFGTVVYATTAAVGLVVVVLTRRPRD